VILITSWQRYSWNRYRTKEFLHVYNVIFVSRRKCLCCNLYFHRFYILSTFTRKNTCTKYRSFVFTFAGQYTLSRIDSGDRKTTKFESAVDRCIVSRQLSTAGPARFAAVRTNWIQLTSEGGRNLISTLFAVMTNGQSDNGGRLRHIPLEQPHSHSDYFRKTCRQTSNDNLKC